MKELLSNITRRRSAMIRKCICITMVVMLVLYLYLSLRLPVVDVQISAHRSPGDLLDSPEDPVSETDENRGETVEETVEMKDEEDEKDEKDEIEESSGIDLDKRKGQVKAAMVSAWGRYKQCAWGYDNLHPDSCTGSNWFNFGLTIIDSMDTLLLMGLTDELNEARKWVAQLDFRKGSKNSNLFEVTIRVLGSLVSMATLTKDNLYVLKAVELGDILLNCFNTKSGIPYSDIDFKTGKAHKAVGSELSSLSEITTLQLEFNELSRLTGDSKYQAATDRAITIVLDNAPSDNLLGQFIDIDTGVSSGDITLGARSDSYYEYLLKQWIQTKEERFRAAYLSSMEGVRERLLFKSDNNLTYIAELRYGTETVVHKMDHLVCFLPGTLALGTLYGCPHWHLQLAEDIIETCMEMYNTKSGLAPEIVKFSNGRMFIASNDEFSLLRPETVESLFVLWRITHREKYRAWAWDVFSAIERSARNAKGHYSSISHIKRPILKRLDSMESFLLAETLKYLYLIHEPDSVLPLTDYVFNTEAHPIPVIPHIQEDCCTTQDPSRQLLS